MILVKPLILQISLKSEFSVGENRILLDTSRFEKNMITHQFARLIMIDPHEKKDPQIEIYLPFSDIPIVYQIFVYVFHFSPL